MKRLTAPAAAALLLVQSAWGDVAPPPSAWPDTPLARTEALALLQTLNADLLSHDSATLTLERWCGAHGMASPAKVIARRVRGQDKPLPASMRMVLQIGDAEPVKYRRVQLMCGSHMLSEADNWYVPSRLTPAMNRLLESSDTPFGKAVKDLHFRRRTLSAELLWSPLPAGWEMRGSLATGTGTALSVPPHVIQHRAVLFDANQQPFSALIETYTDQVLAFPPPSIAVSSAGR